MFLLAPFFVFASNTNGTIDPTDKYGWGENIGWLNFGSTEGDITVTDTVLGGYIWGENIGWVSLNCSNDNSCATVDYKIVNDGNGNLSGYAWGENIGWINFDPTYGGVIINSTGEFTGYAWGENIGWILFNCVDENTCASVDYKVKTDWRPQNSRPHCNNATDDDADGKIDYPSDPGCSSLEDDEETDPVSGGGGGLPTGFSNAPQTPVSGFKILINNGETKTNQTNVNLNLVGGADTVKMSLSNIATFENASQENYQNIKQWDLCAGLKNHPWCFLSTEEKEKLIKSGDKISYRFVVYAKFFTQYGYASQPVEAEIFFEPTQTVIPLQTLPVEAPKNIQPSNPPVTQEKEDKNILEKIGDFLEPMVPEFLKPEEKPVVPEIPVEKLVPSEAPLSLRGRWNLIAPDKINELVFAPLPKELNRLAVKMPQLSETFAEVGVQKMADLEKLRNTKLILPDFMEAIGLGAELTTEIKTAELKNLPAMELKTGILAGEKSLPMAMLDENMKEKMPTEILFFKNTNGLIDYKVALSLNDRGEPEQEIRTVVGKTLRLSIKAEKGAKEARGYVVFKSKETATDYQNKTIGQTTPDKFKTLVLNRGEDGETIQDKKFGIMSREVAVNIYETGPTANLAVVDIKQGQVLGVATGEGIEERLVLQEFSYNDDDNDGIYTAEITAPAVEGEYDIITIIDYEVDGKIVSKEILMRTVVDPEGYVFEKIKDKELRLPKVQVAIYRLNQAGEYELWPAKEYNQENPQITDVTGKYSFLVPPGKYYLTAEADGYASYQSEMFEVSAGPGVHTNIELKTKHWYLKMIDWKTLALLALFVLVAFNFYKDKKRKNK